MREWMGGWRSGRWVQWVEVKIEAEVEVEVEVEDEVAISGPWCARRGRESPFSGGRR